MSFSAHSKPAVPVRAEQGKAESSSCPPLVAQPWNRQEAGQGNSKDSADEDVRLPYFSRMQKTFSAKYSSRNGILPIMEHSLAIELLLRFIRKYTVVRPDSRITLR